MDLNESARKNGYLSISFVFWFSIKCFSPRAWPFKLVLVRPFRFLRFIKSKFYPTVLILQDYIYVEFPELYTSVSDEISYIRKRIYL